ncbi:MAG: sugar ABC transporter ATP-binding protein [Oscillospiraceae bacterium]|jgi:ABC-type sugar transport system ATPase subunit|nr:sugar ABC transporter ATP-binding protein [Oscillospiraceae bacterium]
MDKNTILTMQGIVKSFGVVRAVTNGHLELKKGEVHALVGANGAGKSTLINILSGSLRPDAGIISYNGESTVIPSPLRARALGIGKIHQELQLVPELSVGENLFLGREPRTKLGFVHYDKLFADTAAIMASFDLKVSPKTKVKELRVGEQQLVEIAKATSLNARIVIMDEPTSALSKHETKKLFDVVRHLKSDGVSVIYITHRMEEVFEITDRITVMRDGAYIATVETAVTTREDLVRMMVGHDLAKTSTPAQTSAGAEILRVEDMCLTFPPFYKKANLQHISFSLHSGEVLGIAGLMGAGRTELFECLFGLHARAMSGQIRIDGKQVSLRSPQDAIRHKIALLTEDRKGQGLVLSRSIGENISLPILKALSSWIFVNMKRERPLWRRQMENMQIKAPSFHTLAGHLSGGNQQKVVIGRWLLTDPRILLLDEPTRGIDVGAKEEVYQIISTLSKAGKGILVVSSELPELLDICDRILTFCEGRLTGEFARSEANQEVLLNAATLSTSFH